MLPELAVLLGELQFATNNFEAEKEGLLRYYSNFFYMMDELIEKEDKRGGFNHHQKPIISKMFKLFFDMSNDSSGFEQRLPPIASDFEDYENMNDIYNLYNIENLSDLLPDDLEDMYEELATPIPSDSNLVTKCGDVYSKKEFSKINIIQFSLNEVMIDYKEEKAFMKDFNLNFPINVNNFKFSNNDKIKF